MSKKPAKAPKEIKLSPLENLRGQINALHSKAFSLKVAPLLIGEVEALAHGLKEAFETAVAETKKVKK